VTLPDWAQNIRIKQILVTEQMAGLGPAGPAGSLSEAGMCCCRLRLSANPGRSDEVRVVVEVLPVVANLSMVQVIKSRGTSVEFYKFYADLAQQLQGLISQNALSLPPAVVAHQAALMTGQQSAQVLPGNVGRNTLDMQQALDSVQL